MSSPASTAKTCIACGQDCSNKPRTKDASGRYTCKECFDKLAAKRQQAAAARPAQRPVSPVGAKADDPGDDAVMAALMTEAAPATTEQCPSCGAGMTSEAVVCTICGHNKFTGRGIGIKVEKAPSQAGQAVLGAASAVGGVAAKGIAASMSPITVFLVCLVVFCAPPVLLLAAPDSQAAATAISGLLALIVLGFTLVAGFRTSAATGLILLVTLFIPFVNLYWLYFVFSVSESGNLKAAWGANIIAVLIMLFAIMSKASGAA